jgi:hypothetical protein
MTLCTPYIDRNDLVQCGCPETDGVTMDFAIQSASEMMYLKLGQQFPGTCEATVRPCSQPVSSGGVWSWPWIPWRIGGEWVNTGACGCNRANDCGCKPYPRVNLGRQDIQSIEEVTIDDVALDPSAYRLDQRKYLVRTDGSGWPCCQDLAKNSGEGTWFVELTYGNPIPQVVKDATAALATEYVKACVGDNSCRLPRKVQSVVKQGVSFVMLDDIMSLPEVSAVIDAYNPKSLIGAPKVFSPDVATARWP